MIPPPPLAEMYLCVCSRLKMLLKDYNAPRGLMMLTSYVMEELRQNMGPFEPHVFAEPFYWFCWKVTILQKSGKVNMTLVHKFNIYKSSKFLTSLCASFQLTFVRWCWRILGCNSGGSGIRWWCRGIRSRSRSGSSSGVDPVCRSIRHRAWASESIRLANIIRRDNLFFLHLEM